MTAALTSKKIVSLPWTHPSCFFTRDLNNLMARELGQKLERRVTNAFELAVWR
jgi:hypothetical protein